MNVLYFEIHIYYIIAIVIMSAVLPRSKNSKFAKPLSHSNKDECKKKTFTGTNVSGKSKSSIKSQEAEAPIQDHVRIVVF